MILVFVSCGTEYEYPPEGHGTYNPPRFETYDTTFTSDGGDFTIRQTDTEPWSFDLYKVSPKDKMTEDYLKTIDSINVERELWGQEYVGRNKMYEGSWYKIERIDSRQLKAHIRPNTTNKPRYLLLAVNFLIPAGPASIYIRIAQDR